MTGVQTCALPIYRWAADVSAYVAEPARGQGLGRALYEALFALLKRQGFHTAWAGIALPGVEFGIALSVLLAGVLIAALVRVPALVGAGVILLFMLFHGHAHGTEMAVTFSPYAYAAGFILMTAALHIAGIALSFMLKPQENQNAAAWVGGGIAMAGAILLFI